VIAGLKAYETNSARAAFDVWCKGSLEGDKASRDVVINALTQTEGYYGKMKGHEILKTVRIGSAVRRTYLVLLYERGPAYAYIECYRAGEKWLVTDLLFNTKANLVFPPSLLGG
jgi:hypothetical protein